MRPWTKVALRRLATIYPMSTGMNDQMARSTSFGAAMAGNEDSDAAALVTEMETFMQHLGPTAETRVHIAAAEDAFMTAFKAWIGPLQKYLFSAVYGNILNITCPQGEARFVSEMADLNGEFIPSDPGLQELEDACRDKGTVVINGKNGEAWIEAAKASLMSPESAQTALGEIGAVAGVRFITHDIIKQMFVDSGVPELLGIAGGGGEICGPDGPTKSSPTITAVQVMDPAVQYGQAATGIVTVFLNHIPAFELSRCVPHFKLGISNPVKPINLDGSINSFSQVRFLLDEGDAPEEGLANFHMIRAAGPGGDPEQAELGNQYVGMEVFSSPQTMVNYGVKVRSHALDPSRPFMTLRSFSVSVIPTRGAMATQTGELQLVLHDRSRLSEIAELVKPDFLGKVELHIEYGWSHPDPYTSDFGAILDSMKTAQKFQCYQSTFSMTDDGQVQILMKLISKGTGGVNFTDAAMSGQVKVNWVAVEEAMAAVKAVRRDALKNPALRDIAGTQAISTLSLSSTGMLLTGGAAGDITQWIKDYKTGTGDVSLLATKLGELKTAVTTATEALEAQLFKKVAALKKQKTASENWDHAYDPFCMSNNGSGLVPMLLDEAAAPWMYNRAGGGQGTTMWVSFGKVCSMFLALPMAASMLYDEVQMVFYAANENAGWAAGMNLGTLPIDMRSTDSNDFHSLLKKEYKKYGGTYPVTRMMNWIAQNFIESQFALCYGLTSTNSTASEGMSNMQVDDDGRLVPKDPGTKLGAIQGKNEARLRQAYYAGAAGSEELPIPFRPINLKIYFEVLAGDPEAIRTITGEEPTDDTQDRTILRVHICDSGATYSGVLSQVITKFRDNDSGVIDCNSLTKRLPGINPDLYGESIVQPISTRENEVWKELTDEGIIIPFTAGARAGDVELLQAKVDEIKAMPEKQQNQTELAYLENVISAIGSGDKREGLYVLYTKAANLYRWIKKHMPYINYGSEGTAIKSMSVQTLADSKTASMYMVRSSNDSTSDTAGNQGLPMQLMPVQMSAEMVGCPLMEYMQQYFVDMNTGTSIDNRYVVTGIDHKLEPGTYTTSVKFTPLDAFAQFNSAASKLGESVALVAAAAEMTE